MTITVLSSVLHNIIGICLTVVIVYLDRYRVLDCCTSVSYDYVYYPHMPIGKAWIYRLVFVCLFVIL